MKKALLFGILLVAVSGCAHKMNAAHNSENRTVASASNGARIDRPRVAGSCQIELSIKAVCSIEYYSIKPKSVNHKDWNIDKPIARYEYAANSWEDCYSAAVMINSDRKQGRDIVDEASLQQTFNVLENGSRTDVCGKTFLERLGMGDDKEIKSSKFSFHHEYFEDLPSYAKWKYTAPGINAKGALDYKASIDNPMPGDLRK